VPFKDLAPCLRPVIGLILASKNGGAEGIRTPDLLLAKQALSQLSYSPNVNYCIKYCLVAKALSFLVYGIAAILNKEDI
jgi:hypothetical protein